MFNLSGFIGYLLKFFFIEICLIKYEFNKVFKIGNDLEEILWLKMSYLI